MPYLGKSPSQGVRTRFQFTPNAGTTSISGADANGLTLSFTDGNYVDVYLNGVMLKAGVDYNTNTANTIAGLSATVASDVVDIVVYDTFSLFGGTLEGNVKVNNGTFNVTGAVDFDSTLNVDGVVTANAGVVVDNITIDGTEIDLSSGNLTIDVANDIILDSGDGDIQLKDTGSTFLNIYESSDHAYLYNPRSNGDIIFQGNGVSEALRLDMSASGAATFGGAVNIGTTGSLSNNSGTFLIDANTNLNFRGGIQTFDNADGSVEYMRLNSTGLGIGTSPSNKLDIATSDNAYAARIVNNSDGSQGLLIQTSDNDTSEYILNLQSSTSATGTNYSSKFAVSKYGTTTITNETSGAAVLQVRNFATSSTGAFTGSYASEFRTVTATSTHGMLIHHAENNASRRTLDVTDNTGTIATFVQGRVGINTTNPISYANGEATLFIEDSGNPAITISDTGQTYDYFMVANGSRLGIVYGEGSNSSSASNITEIASFNNNGNVGIGTDSPQFKLHVNKGSSNYAPSNGVDENIVGFQTSYDSGGSQIVTFSNLDGNWVDGTSGADSAFGWLWGYQNLVRGGLIYDHRGTERMQMFSSYGTISFITPDSADGDAVPTDSNMTERLVIAPGGDVSIGKTAVDTSTVGTDLYSYGLAVFVRNNGVVGLFNRLTSDGDLVTLRQAGSEEGTISVSGSTVSYNGFSGLHESSGIASNIPVGTVCSTIDELDVYPDSQPDGKGGTEDHPKKGQTRADHAKIKVSDTEGDKRVYGVLQRYDDNGKPLVASVGIGSIRVTGACEGGDLLESNGDGTAKVQSDDIIRSKTIGKVTIGNSDTSVKLVSCVLYCG